MKNIHLFHAEIILMSTPLFKSLVSNKSTADEHDLRPIQQAVCLWYAAETHTNTFIGYSNIVLVHTQISLCCCDVPTVCFVYSAAT